MMVFHQTIYGFDLSSNSRSFNLVSLGFLLQAVMLSWENCLLSVTKRLTNEMAFSPVHFKTAEKEISYFKQRDTFLLYNNDMINCMTKCVFPSTCMIQIVWFTCFLFVKNCFRHFWFSALHLIVFVVVLCRSEIVMILLKTITSIRFRYLFVHLDEHGLSWHCIYWLNSPHSNNNKWFLLNSTKIRSNLLFRWAMFIFRRLTFWNVHSSFFSWLIWFIKPIFVLMFVVS